MAVDNLAEFVTNLTMASLKLRNAAEQNSAVTLEAHEVWALVEAIAHMTDRAL